MSKSTFLSPIHLILLSFVSLDIFLLLLRPIELEFSVSSFTIVLLIIFFSNRFRYGRGAPTSLLYGQGS